MRIVLDAVMEELKTLPPSRMEQVLDYVRQLRSSVPPANNGPDAQTRDHDLERNWLAHKRQNFTGQWVALSGTSLLASGNNAAEVYRLASRSSTSPFVAYVEAGDPPPFAGWA